MNIKDLRESAGPFFWLVPKWCPVSARHFFHRLASDLFRDLCPVCLFGGFGHRASPNLA